MTDANSVLPPGYRWVNPPNIMVGNFHGFLPGGDINIWYHETTGWGRIEQKDFAPEELEQLEPGCKIERFCGDAIGPEGKKFMIRARKATGYPIQTPALATANRRSKSQTIWHVIWLRTGQCVVRFSYPPIIHTQQNENGSYCRPQVNEIPVSECCYAVLGNERPYKFDSQEAAKYIASAIPGAKVELWED